MSTPNVTTTTPYSLFIKSESAKCNLDCHYCYYLKNEDKKKPGMDSETLEKMIVNHIKCNLAAAYRPLNKAHNN